MKTQKITLYHNSRCSKSRGALEILEKSKLPFEIVEYLTNPPSAATLKDLLQKLKLTPDQLVRTSEDEYEELNLKDKPPKTIDDWLKILMKYPVLIERPIVADATSAVIGRPPERVGEWLKATKTKARK